MIDGTIYVVCHSVDLDSTVAWYPRPQWRRETVMKGCHKDKDVAHGATATAPCFVPWRMRARGGKHAAACTDTVTPRQIPDCGSLCIP